MTIREYILNIFLRNTHSVPKSRRMTTLVTIFPFCWIETESDNVPFFGLNHNHSSVGDKLEQIIVARVEYRRTRGRGPERGWRCGWAAPSAGTGVLW